MVNNKDDIYIQLILILLVASPRKCTGPNVVCTSFLRGKLFLFRVAVTPYQTCKF
jgi:hypothetical protein